MVQYMLRVNSDNLWKKFKSRLIFDSYTIKGAIETFIQLYADGKIKLPKK